ncbi:hypothetical protein [Thioalbus denitrificans]|uniref:Uncharacterized protein n=1 Tax=Thioalbus denitrificans TaxID=547122 RepID=A0A369CFP0_9GAMM|nr:hypothetical protein [Thioalbus denitrificans]RCX32371.1 hypothetical protein DFQ59_102733 [Thioalbus denitrificans]
MKLCENCKEKLPYLIAYVAFLAAFLSFLTGVLTGWNPVTMGVIFLLGCGLGVLHVTYGSCRLCRRFGHQGHAH